MPLILASQSPQRERLARLLGLEFMPMPSQFDEYAVPTPNVHTPQEFATYAETLAAGKVLDVLSTLQTQNSLEPGTLIFGGDLVLTAHDRIYHKPKNMEEAARFTRELAGVTHHEYSALAVWSQERGLKTTVVSASVTTPELSDEEVQWYLNQSQPLGAAGGYRVGAIARALRPRKLPLSELLTIQGPLSAIIGLPAEALSDLLTEYGHTPPRPAHLLEAELFQSIFAESQPSHLQTLFYTQE